MTSAPVVTAQLTLSDSQRRFAIAMVAQDGDIRYAARQAGVSNPEEMLQIPSMQTYIEYLRGRLTDIQDAEDRGLRDRIASREDAGRILTRVMEDPMADPKDIVAAARVFLAAYKPESAERRQVLTVQEVERKMEGVG